MNTEKSNLEKQLSILRKNYLQTLPKKMERIKNLWASWKNLPELYRLVHNIAGAGKSFGQNDIGKRAHRMEMILEKILPNRRKPTPAEKKRMIREIQCLFQALESHPYRVMIIDDDPELARYYSTILEEARMQTQVVNNPMEALKSLSDFNPDLILMDLYMPKMSGVELAKNIRHNSRFVGIPIVFLSTETMIQKQCKAMESGSDDFLTKPITPSHLVSSVTSRIKRHRILRGLMTEDSLTGLLNHTAIEERLKSELAHAKRDHDPLSFVLIDIDHFKNINDTYGHVAGDHVLKNLAKLLQQRLRESTGIGRYGGEEFAIVLDHCDIQSAKKVVDEIRENFAKMVQKNNGHSFSVTLSAGIAAFPAKQNALSLTKAADQALYKAKGMGRNKVITFDSAHP